jgi:ABC-type transport system substrate-binding protein
MKEPKNRAYLYPQLADVKSVEVQDGTTTVTFTLNNETGYSNPRVDQLPEKARQVFDFKERQCLYAEVLKAVQNDVPEIYLFMGPKFLGVQPYVKGFSPGSFQDKFSYVGGGLSHTWMEK